MTSPASKHGGDVNGGAKLSPPYRSAQRRLPGFLLSSMPRFDGRAWLKLSVSDYTGAAALTEFPWPTDAAVETGVLFAPVDHTW